TPSTRCRLLLYHNHIFSSHIFLSSPLTYHSISSFFFFNDTPTTEIYTLSLHDALPIFDEGKAEARLEGRVQLRLHARSEPEHDRSEEHTSELQSLTNLVCRLLLEKKKKNEGRHVEQTIKV